MSNFQLMLQENMSDNDIRNMMLKLLLSMKDYARSSIMTGSTHNGTPVIGGKVVSDTYTETASNSYLQFDFPEAPLLNDITFHLWDHDDRVYTYSIDVLSNGGWKNVIENRQGKGIQYIHFPDMEKVKAIRMKGTNTINAFLHLLNDSLSFRYTL